MELTEGKWKASRSSSGSWKVDTDDALIANEVRERDVYAITAVPELVEACEAMIDCSVEVSRLLLHASVYLLALSKINRAMMKVRGEQQGEEA